MEPALRPVQELLRKIPGSLDAWTDVNNEVRCVESAHYLDRNILLGFFSNVSNCRTRLYTKDIKAQRSTANAEWVSLASSSPGWTLDESSIERIWVAKPQDRRQSVFSSKAENFVHQILVLTSDRIVYTITVEDTAGYPYKYTAVEHLRLPQGLDEDSLQITWNPQSQIVVAALGSAPATAASAVSGAAPSFARATGNSPKILPQSQKQVNESKSLMYFNTAMRSWQPVCNVGVTAEYLSLSGCGNRAVWREMICSEAEEESERGEFYGADLPSPVIGETQQGQAVSRGFGQITGQRGVQKTQLTTGAGRVDCARLNGDGSVIALLANFEKARPITTHRDLYLVEWPAAAASDGRKVAGATEDVSPPLRLTDPGLRDGGSIEDFGWVPLERPKHGSATTATEEMAAVEPTSLGRASRGATAARDRGQRETCHGEGMLWFSEIRGVERLGRILHVDVKVSSHGPHSMHSLRIHDLPCAPVTGTVDSILDDDAAGGTGLSLAFGSETDAMWPHVADVHVEPLPAPLRPGLVTASANQAPSLQLHPAPDNNQIAFDDLTVEVVQWQARDGQQLEGLLYERRGANTANPLLVLAHGGPAGAFASDRTAAANSTRYPVRHYLKAGYRVFMPLYRGTLGFGDEFAQANIRKQGGVDLGDIASGVRHLLSEHPRVACRPNEVGIFGGSYGGYLTLRALSKIEATRGEEPPFRYVVGVSEYGFLHNRWMSYEGGDFSWEDEYVGATGSFPPKKCAADVFDDLGKVRAPCLLLHGEDDGICPLSQSRVGYNALRHAAKVPTGLIVYPGEGHGFKQPDHRRDRDRRMLVWFLTYLPLAAGEDGSNNVDDEPRLTSVEAAAALEGRELHPEELAMKMQSAVADAFGQSMRKAFLAVDKNRDGLIDRREFEALLARQNLNQFPAETEALLNLVDRTGDGKLDYSEFVSALDKASTLQAKSSEAQDGYRQPSTNFYEREAQRVAARRAREEAEAARWSAARSQHAGKNTASSIFLASADPGPKITGGSHLQNRRFAGANTASAVMLGDDGTLNRPPSAVNHTQYSTPAHPSRTTRSMRTTDVHAGKNTSSSVTFSDPSNFLSNSNRKQSTTTLLVGDPVEEKTPLKRFAGRNVASSISFEKDGVLSNADQLPGPLSSVRCSNGSRTASDVHIDHINVKDDGRLHPRRTTPSEFISRVREAAASPMHGTRKTNKPGFGRDRRARSPPPNSRVAVSSLQYDRDGLVSNREAPPRRPIRAKSPGKNTQDSTYEIAETPGPISYKPKRHPVQKSNFSHSPAGAAAFLSHHNKGEPNTYKPHQQDPVDPARFFLGGRPAVAGSKYVAPAATNPHDMMMKHNPARAERNRFAGKSQASSIVMDPKLDPPRPPSPNRFAGKTGESTIVMDPRLDPPRPPSPNRFAGKTAKSSLIFG